MTINQVSLPINFDSRGLVFVTQGFGGKVSHSGQLYHSLDFTYGDSSILGAPIVAHDTGIVVDLRESVKDGKSSSTGLSDPSNGPSNIGNFVTIYYPATGVYITNAHLSENGVLPTIGQTVYAGDTIGYVGNTGYRTGTHLHSTYSTGYVDWKAGKVADGSKSLGTPVSFDTANGQIGTGVLSQVSIDLTNLSVMPEQHDMYLFGKSNINGYGDNMTNLLSGNRGNNILDGRSGDDKILGGNGDDILIGGSGNDILVGGSGVDTASYASSSSVVSVNLTILGSQNTGIATGYDELSLIENLIGGSFSDFLKGDSAQNRIEGGSGFDVIDGGSGNDILYGGKGNDIITGGLGKDYLSGGSGKDIFDFNLTSESGAKSSGRDVISDFQYGDRIDLSDIDANVRISGDQKFRFIGDKAFTKGVVGEISLSGGILRGEVNGDGSADFSIQVSGVSILSPLDFIL